MDNNFINFHEKKYTDFRPLLKDFRKKEGKEKLEIFYDQIIYPSELCPRCIVTNHKLFYHTYKTYGLRCGSLIKNLYKKHKNQQKCLEELKNLNAFFIPELNGYFTNWKDTSGSCSTKEKKELIYNQYFLNKTKCSLNGCDKKVPLELVGKNACCTLHYNRSQMLKKGRYKESDLKYTCVLDNEKFPTLNHFSQHIKKQGWDLENYYNQFVNQNAEKQCKWCQKPTKFKNVREGYFKFCHNTNCNILWHNKHTQRHLNGDKISESQKRNQNMTSQLGYWIKKGYSEEEARKKLSERQTTNSIKAIQKRHNCTEEEAIQKRQEITKKWINSYKKNNFSKISQELFWCVYEKIKDRVNPEDVFFATYNKGTKGDLNLNYEFKLKTKNTFRMLDFYISSNLKIIEFDGVYWHGKIGRGNKTSEKKRDEEILESLKGAKILHVNEKKFLENKEAVVQDCVKFLFEETPLI
jgi:hypothetical protein